LKAIRYIVGVIGFLMVMIVVAVVVGFVMVLIFPLDAQEAAGSAGGWRNIPGTILGLLAGIQSFRASVRDPKKETR
jgi:membrane associated rhomboid family serine protease